MGPLALAVGLARPPPQLSSLNLVTLVVRSAPADPAVVLTDVAAIGQLPGLPGCLRQSWQPSRSLETLGSTGCSLSGLI